MENIFSTKERIKILKFVVYKTGIISVNNIASELKLSKGLVSKYLDILVKNGVAKRAKGKFVINNSPFTRGIKIILNLMGIDPRIFKKYPFVESVGLYGSCAKGENHEDSDVDLWIKIEAVSEEKQAVLISEIRKKINKVKVLLLTKKRLGKIREEDNVFYNSLFFGSITIYGDENGL
jgi:predicted nucleotidyltransferase